MFGNDKNAGEGLKTEPRMLVSAWGPLQAAVSLLLKNLRQVNKKRPRFSNFQLSNEAKPPNANHPVHIMEMRPD